MLRDNYEWDGRERRYADRRIAKDEGYYIPEHHEQPVIIEQPPKDNKWLSPSVLVAMLYPIMGAIATFSWNTHDRITAVEYKIQSVVDRHNQHEKEDIEFKNELKDLNTKIDKLKEQLSSVDQTMMQMMSESFRNNRRSP